MPVNVSANKRTVGSEKRDPLPTPNMLFLSLNPNETVKKVKLINELKETSHA